jgi:hypothetical protein
VREPSTYSGKWISRWYTCRCRTRVIIEPDDQEEEPPGPLATKEIQAQQTSIVLLDMKGRPDTQAIEAVRRLSQAQAAELVAVMPELARR